MPSARHVSETVLYRQKKSQQTLGHPPVYLDRLYLFSIDYKSNTFTRLSRTQI